jgi:hypothetical protein
MSRDYGGGWPGFISKIRPRDSKSLQRTDATTRSPSSGHRKLRFTNCFRAHFGPAEPRLCSPKTRPRATALTGLGRGSLHLGQERSGETSWGRGALPASAPLQTEETAAHSHCGMDQLRGMGQAGRVLLVEFRLCVPPSTLCPSAEPRHALCAPATGAMADTDHAATAPTDRTPMRSSVMRSFLTAPLLPCTLVSVLFLAPAVSACGGPGAVQGASASSSAPPASRPPPDTTLARVDRLGVPSQLATTDTLAVRLSGTVGPNGCYSLTTVDTSRTPRQVLLRPIVQPPAPTDQACTMAVVPLDTTVRIPPPFPVGPLRLTVPQNDRPPVTVTVEIVDD